MSHCLHILDPRLDDLTLPQTLADFDALRMRLEQLQVSGLGLVWNRRYVQFASELVQRFPWLAPDARTPDDPVYWLRDPVAEALDLHQGAWALKLPRDTFTAAIGAMAEIAERIGLVLYDRQSGIGFLPDGGIVPTPWAEHLRAGTPLGMRRGWLADRESARQALRLAFEWELGPHGFQYTEHEGHADSVLFERRVGPVFQRISVRPLISHNRCDNLMLGIGDERISTLVAHHLQRPARPGWALRVDGRFFQRGFSAFPLGVARDALPVARYAREHLVPLADIGRDLFGIDQLLNHPSSATVRSPTRRWHPLRARPVGSDGAITLAALIEGHGSPSVRPERLVAAWLNGNPGHPELEAAFVDIKAPDLTDDPLQNQRLLTEHAERVKRARAFADQLRRQTPLAAWSGRIAFDGATRPFPEHFHDDQPHPDEGRVHNLDVALHLEDALATPLAFLERFGGSREAWADFWRERGETLPEADRIPAEGLGWHRDSWHPGGLADPLELLTLIFPPAQPRLEETQIVALARSGATWRGFMLGNQPLRDLRGLAPQLRVLNYHPAKPDTEPKRDYASTRPLTRMPTPEVFRSLVVELFRGHA